MVQPAARPGPVYPVIFIDAIVVKVRDGQVRNKPIYVVVGVTVGCLLYTSPSPRDRS